MKKTALICALILLGMLLQGQGFLHADGKRIVNGAGENIILRGIGTGNWMLQEGYMMETVDIAGSHHEFREKLIESIGEIKTDSFYTVWLNNHCQRADIDSLASWGFNCVRVAMHYKWFTLPIEDEPVSGENTWLTLGFEMIDSLLDWCGENQMYLILDLHGAPGGQGESSSISDYDPSKPSLWESLENKNKTIALWAQLATRYAHEPWIGGYDLINEINWTFPEGNNFQIRELFGQITSAIRAVDQNHMIIIEGNGFANDFTRLTPPWDDNLVYSFHKYWTYNDAHSLDWVLGIRDTHNVPLWLGESGENSNTWYTNLIALCENENIGWSWWPLKKTGINNPLRVNANEDYLNLIRSWKGEVVPPGEEEAFQAVLKFADNHRIGHCSYQRDVVDAMMRQPFSGEPLPYVPLTADSIIFASDYDMGRNGMAYFDLDTANYHLNQDGKFTAWNQGWTYRNDGVDIEECSDPQLTNGYNVGWTEDGEWLNYTRLSDSLASYTMEIRSSSAGSGSLVHLEIDGVDATGPIFLPGTGSWQNWTSTEVPHLLLPEGAYELKVVFDRGGSNLNFLKIKDPTAASELPFHFISARSAVLSNELYISLNKEVTGPETFSANDFTLVVNGVLASINSISLSETDRRVLLVTPQDPLFFDDQIKIAYSGNQIKHESQLLEAINYENVENRFAEHHMVPGRIEAEEFFLNKGLELELCSDIGGGYNTAHANQNDLTDYLIWVQDSGYYTLTFRVATERDNASLLVQCGSDSGFTDMTVMEFSRTGGWQNWETQSTELNLPAGKYLLRLKVNGAEHNLNWIEFTSHVGIQHVKKGFEAHVYPNPASMWARVRLDQNPSKNLQLDLVDARGRLLMQREVSGVECIIGTAHLASGVYYIRLYDKNRGQKVLKFLVKHR